MVGWHNAVATRLGEALAETEGREPRDGKASQYFDSSLSVTPFHGAQNYSHLKQGQRSLSFACPCLSSFAPIRGLLILPSLTAGRLARGRQPAELLLRPSEFVLDLQNLPARYARPTNFNMHRTSKTPGANYANTLHRVFKMFPIGNILRRCGT